MWKEGGRDAREGWGDEAPAGTNERKKNWARGVRGERKSRVVDEAGKDCLAVAGL